MIASILLLVNGVFAFAVWPTFYRRILADPRARDASGRPTRFLTVHRTLIAIALVLGVASIAIGVLTLTGVTN